MSYEITLPNGEVVEVDDAVAPEKAAEIIKKQRKELFQTELLSPQGIKGLFSTMGENIDASILGAKKGLHQEILDAMQTDLKRYTPGTPEHQQQLQKIQEQQQTTHEYAAGTGHLRQTIEREVPNPSIPMEAAMGVAPSMVNMAPSLLTRNPMPLAQQGLEQFRGQAYGAARDQGATPGAASMYGNISGPMEAITEWMPMGKMFNSLGREATSMIIAKTLGREIASEEVNTIVDKFAEQAIVTPDKPIAQFLAEMGHDIAVTGLQAGMQTAAMAPLIHSANTPGITDSTPRDLPPIEEAPPSNKTSGLPPAPAPGPAFTDSAIGYEQSRTELAALEAEVDAGLELTQEIAQPVDIKALLQANTNQQGAVQADQISDQIVQQVQTALSNGATVTLYADGKPISIVAISRGMMVDEVGNRWGTMRLLTDPEGKLGNRLEISYDSSRIPVTSPTNPDISPQMQVLNNRVLADFGMTPEVRNNPHNFDDPNTSVEPSERRVVRALGISGITNQKWGGTDLSKIDLSNGPVVLQVGEDNHVRPAHYMKGLIEDIYRLAQEFNPQGVYVILPQDAGVRGDPKAERGAHFYQDGVHYIIPKHLTNQTKSGSHKSKPGAGNYSPYANLDAYSTMGHEFGHSLIQDFFFQGLAPQERTLLELALEQGQVLPELTAKLNPAAQAILTSWQELREGVKSGKVSRTEAAVRLLSPAKLQNKTLMKRMRGLVEYQLEFNEYLAEQVAKAMFTQERMGQSKTLENTFTYNRFEPGTVLGNMEAAIQSWLGPLLETMKQLFGRLSAMEMAGPAASSAEWLKQLQLNAHELVQQRMERVKAYPVKVAEAPVEEPVIDYTNPSHQNILRNTLKQLRESGQIKTNSKEHRKLAQMLNNGQYVDFVNAIESYLTDKLNFDITSAEAADTVGWTPAWVLGHGSTAIWNTWGEAPLGKVDLSKVFTGEATIWQGWGFYSGEAKKTYRHYARHLPTPQDSSYRREDGKYFDYRGVREQVKAVLRRTPGFTGFLKAHFAHDETMGELYLDDLGDFILQNAYTDSYKMNKKYHTAKFYLDEFRRWTQYAIVQINRTSNEYIPKYNINDWQYLVPAMKKALTFTEQKGERNIRHIEIKRPFDEFLYWDFNLSLQSPKVQAAIAKLPERFRKVFGTVPNSSITKAERDQQWASFSEAAEAYTKAFNAWKISPEAAAAFNDLGWYTWYSKAESLFQAATNIYPPKAPDAFSPTDITMENAYWEMHRIIAQERGLPTGRGGVQAGKIVSQILAKVGIAGNAYLNYANRGKHSVPPAQATRSWNVVTFREEDVRVLAKDDTPRPTRSHGNALKGFNIQADKVGQANAQKAWAKEGFNSENWKAWFEGSKVVTASGQPLLMYFNTSVDYVANSREFAVGVQNPINALWWAGAATPSPGSNTRIIPGWMSIKNPVELEVDSPHIPTERIKQDILRARSAGYDGIIYRAPNRADDIYVASSLNNATFDPNYKHTGSVTSSAVHFDRTDFEGETAATRWQLLRDTLKLPHLADSIAKFWSLQWSTLQMQQLAHMNPQWHWMHNFSANVQKFYRKVGQMHSRADAVVRQLQWLGKENISKLQKFTLAEYKSGVHWTELRRKDDLGHWEHIPTETTYAKLKEFGIDPDSTSGKRFLRLYIEAKNALQYQMDEQQRVMYELQAKKYSAPGMEANLRQARLETAALYKQLRAAPYWPQHSFGKYRVQVWSSDAVGKVLLYESATDSETEAKVLEQKARAKYPQGVLKSLVLTPDESFLMRLPVEFLDDLQIILGLDSGNPDDMQKLSQIRDSMQSLYSKVPGQTYDPIKRVVEGGSTDFVKVFADFSLRNSNFIAKMEYRKNMQTDIAGAESDPANQEFSANKAEIARAIEFMKATVNYMMNPQEELATLRGIVAIGYLWGNVKTAVLNFWGLAHTWAWLNRELGYGKGTVTFGKSVWNSTRTQGHEWGSFLGSVMEGAAEGSLLSVTDPNWEMVDGKPTELRQALEQAKQENVLDQSYAYYLATQATRGNLIRMASASLPGKTFKGLVDAGMSLFRGTELLIRRSTFIAAYRTMQQTRPDATPKERYEEAVRLVGLLQGDYTKGNRPELMRGQIKSFITIFMTFVQTASWNAYGGLEKGLRRQEAMEGRASPKFYRNYTAQLVLLYLFMAGLEGLPGMENIMDLLDAMFKKANNGKSAREGLREVLDELNMDPMSVMRGATFNLAGLDLSRSIGLGRIVPGTDVLAEEHGTTKEAIGAGVTAVAGVGGGYIQWLIDTIGATSDAVEAGTDLGVTAERQMARLPGGLGNMFKAAQWAQYDARGPGGGLLAHDEATGMAREIQSWEIAVKSLGFQPASISRAQTLKAGQYEARAFWTARKRVLLDAYWQASEIAKDREAIADARRAIAEYNEAVPTKGLKITPTSIKQSMARRNDAVEAAEQYSTMQKSLQELYQQQAESFALDIAE